MRPLLLALLACAAPSLAADPKPSMPTPGTYTCSMPGAGTMTFIVEGPARYATAYTGKAPKPGDYTASGGQLAFTSGPLAGMYGGVLGPRKVGLTSKAGTRSYSAVCNLKSP